MEAAKKPKGLKIMKKSKFIADFALFAAVIFLAAVAMLAGKLMRSNGTNVIIKLNGDKYAALSLDENASLDVDGYLTVVIENGEVYVSEAKCPDKLCQKHARVSKSGEVIACLPFGITVEIVGSEYDAVI